MHRITLNGRGREQLMGCEYIQKIDHVLETRDHFFCIYSQPINYFSTTSEHPRLPQRSI